MLGLFKKKTESEKLQEKYESVMKKAYEMSKIDRTKSDALYADADNLLKSIEALKTK